MFCCTLLYVPSRFAIILMGKRELVVLLSLSSWCLVIVVWLFLAVPWVGLQFVIVVFPDYTHLQFWCTSEYLHLLWTLYECLMWDTSSIPRYRLIITASDKSQLI